MNEINRNLHISGLSNEEKVDIESRKVDIQDKKVDIESVLSEEGSNFSVKTTVHIPAAFSLKNQQMTMRNWSNEKVNSG